MTRPGLIFLGLLAAGLAGTLYWEMLPSGAPPQARGRPVQTPSQTQPAPRTDDQTPAWVATMLGRPLFSPGRRPPQPRAAVAAAAGMPDLPRLSAVLISEAGKRVIFSGSGHPIVAEEGSQVGAFVVQSITAGEVTMVGPGGPRILRPTFRTGATPGPLSGPAPLPASTAALPALVASSSPQAPQ